ncbi:MAG: lipid-A-disaccharide synthase, partial [Flammeovirgaceae bacterium]|nr:lipid-A-disaccharide synthase [Flammeovirgaceae bacterium]
MRYYLIAGERSGDLHGSNLIKALRKVDAQAEFRGYGGDYMKEAGMDLIVHYRELAFMGVVQVIANLRTITKRLNQCKIDIVEYKPDVVILIDYADFNLRVAQHARQHGIKTFYYISPKVWAWRQKRALKLKANVDRMFCILPFEKDFYRKFDWDVDYVGNPVLDAVKGFTPNPEFRKKNKLKKEDKLIGLLPGSRSLELKRIIPLMSKVVELNPDETFIVAGVTSLPRELYSEIEAYKNVKIILTRTYDLLSNSHAA